MTEVSKRAAAIRRGQQAALKELRNLDRAGLQELAALYKEAQTELQQRFGHLADGAGQIRIEYLQTVIQIIDDVLKQLEPIQLDLFRLNIESAATTGAGIAGSVGVVAQHTSAVEAVWKLRQADGLQLSDRLWRLNIHTKQSMTREVQAALVRGDSAYRAARDFLNRDMKIPADVLQDQGLSGVNSLTKITGQQLLRDNASAMNNAQRVFRTEMARAHTLAYMDSVDDLDDVVGYKFNLSSNHRRRDICDLHAGANLYGLGRGVYPKDVISRIYPAHPNTTSYVTAVFADEVSKNDKKKDANRIAWLKSQSATTQDAVLGKQKGEWLREGKLTERTINSRVSILKKRFTV